MFFRINNQLVGDACIRRIYAKENKLTITTTDGPYLFEYANVARAEMAFDHVVEQIGMRFPIIDVVPESKLDRALSNLGV